MVIDFSGTVAQVDSAFKAEMHSLDVAGVKHLSNMQNPQIPAALANVVIGVSSLNDFRPKAANKGISAARIDGTSKAVVARTVAANGVKSDYTVNSDTQLVVPDDLHTIYNFEPVYKNGITGKRQTVVVIEDTDVYSTGDWYTFRGVFGLAKYTKGTFTQTHPGGCTDPGDVLGTDGEAILDAEYASAAAPNAAIVLASGADSETTFGGLIALQTLVDQDLPPSIVSISYGECEAELGQAGNASYNEAYAGSGRGRVGVCLLWRRGCGQLRCEWKLCIHRDNDERVCDDSIQRSSRRHGLHRYLLRNGVSVLEEEQQRNLRIRDVLHS
jgi:subtilase family serine protease